MLSNDTQVEQILVANGLLSAQQAAALRAQAGESAQSLYRIIVEQSVIPESVLVQSLAPAMGLGGVSLQEFAGDAMLMSLAPTDLLRDEGMLPIGIDEVAGHRVLYVAMADPTNAAGIARLQCFTALQIIPVLAGPMDLLGAIERSVLRLTQSTDDEEIELGDEDLMGMSDMQLNRLAMSGNRSAAVSGDPAILEELLGSISLSAPAGDDVASALSMIDSIPRDRHSAATPPGGSSTIELGDAELVVDSPEPLQSDDDMADVSKARAMAGFPSLDAPPNRPRTVDLSDLFPAIEPLPENELRGVSGLGGPRLQPHHDSAISLAAPIHDNDSDATSSSLGNTGIGRPSAGVSGAFHRAGRTRTTVVAPTERFAVNPEILERPDLARVLLLALTRLGVLTESDIRAAIEIANRRS